MGQKTSTVRIEAACEGVALARPRDRIIAAARELFHKHGLRSIGVEAIAEAAGSNKMTLYRHFGSKDELIVACLREVADDIDEMWRDLEMAHPGDPMAQLRGWVQCGAECIADDEHGCALANAAVELAEEDHPARRLVEEFKTAHRNHLVRLCQAAGVAQGELLADTLCLLFEGARVSQQSMGAEGPSAKFVRMSEAVIEAFAGR